MTKYYYDVCTETCVLTSHYILRNMDQIIINYLKIPCPYLNFNHNIKLFINITQFSLSFPVICLCQKLMPQIKKQLISSFSTFSKFLIQSSKMFYLFISQVKTASIKVNDSLSRVSKIKMRSDLSPLKSTLKQWCYFLC